MKKILPHVASWSVLACLAGTSPVLAREQAAPTNTDQIMAAVDVVLTHLVVEADGTPAGQISTESAFTLQKVRTRSGAVKIRLTYRRPKRDVAAKSMLRTPLDAARVEYDLASQSTTVFDEGGSRPNPRLLSIAPSPSAAPPGLGSFDSWFQSLVFKDTDLANRRQALERSHGRPAGRVGRFTRYVQPRGEHAEELLVDPASALPVEVNLVKENQLEAHTTIEYGNASRGQMVRRRLRTEQRLDGGAGRRSVLSVDFSNVAAEGR